MDTKKKTQPNQPEVGEEKGGWERRLHLCFSVVLCLLAVKIMRIFRVEIRNAAIPRLTTFTAFYNLNPPLALLGVLHWQPTFDPWISKFDRNN